MISVEHVDSIAEDRKQERRARKNARRRKYIRRCSCNHCGKAKMYVCPDRCGFQRKKTGIDRLISYISGRIKRAYYGRKRPRVIDTPKAPGIASTSEAKAQTT